MKIVGHISNTGEMYLLAYIISRKHDIYGTSLFVIDTGSSVSFISFRDAMKVGIDFDKLRKGDLALGLGGLLESYFLDDVMLLFPAEEKGIMYTKFFGEIQVLPRPSRVEYEVLPSILGRDFLGQKYSIQYQAKTKKVYVTCGRAPTQKIPEASVKEMLDYNKADQKAFLDTYSFIVYPDDFVRELCYYLNARLREFFIAKPTHEKDVQDEIEKLLIARNYEFGRENMTFQFGAKLYTPDFNFPRKETVLEVKFCRSQRRMKEIVGEILSYIEAFNTKFKHQVFVVYDLGVIRRTIVFKREIEKRHKNVVIMVVRH